MSGAEMSDQPGYMRHIIYSRFALLQTLKSTPGLFIVKENTFRQGNKSTARKELAPLCDTRMTLYVMTSKLYVYESMLIYCTVHQRCMSGNYKAINQCVLTFCESPTAVFALTPKTHSVFRFTGGYQHR